MKKILFVFMLLALVSCNKYSDLVEPEILGRSIIRQDASGQNYYAQIDTVTYVVRGLTTKGSIYGLGAVHTKPTDGMLVTVFCTADFDQIQFTEGYLSEQEIELI